MSRCVSRTMFVNWWCLKAQRFVCSAVRSLLMAFKVFGASKMQKVIKSDRLVSCESRGLQGPDLGRQNCHSVGENVSNSKVWVSCSG